MPRSFSTDPYPGFNYLVEVKGLIVAGFTEVSGIGIEVQVEDYREGGVNGYTHRLAGPARYPSNLTLKRGVVEKELLLDWQLEVARGVIKPRNLSVVLLDLAGEEARRWRFKEAYPVRWQGPELRASINAVGIESLELVHKGMS